MSKNPTYKKINQTNIKNTSDSNAPLIDAYSPLNQNIAPKIYSDETFDIEKLPTRQDEETAKIVFPLDLNRAKSLWDELDLDENEFNRYNELFGNFSMDNYYQLQKLLEVLNILQIKTRNILEIKEKCDSFYSSITSGIHSYTNVFQGNNLSLFQLLMLYRYFVICLIEQIVQWRSCFWKPEIYFDDNTNILEKILDQGEFFNTPIAEGFFKRNGIILTNYVLLIPGRNCLYLNMPLELMQRAEACYTILSGERDLQLKVSSKEEHYSSQSVKLPCLKWPLIPISQTRLISEQTDSTLHVELYRLPPHNKDCIISIFNKGGFLLFQCFEPQTNSTSQLMSTLKYDELNFYTNIKRYIKKLNVIVNRSKQFVLCLKLSNGAWITGSLISNSPNPIGNQ